MVANGFNEAWLVHFEVQMSRFAACLNNDCPESSRRSPVCQAGVSNEGQSSSIMIELSNDCKWVFNGVSRLSRRGAMPWSILR